MLETEKEMLRQILENQVVIFKKLADLETKITNNSKKSYEFHIKELESERTKVFEALLKMRTT